MQYPSLKFFISYVYKSVQQKHPTPAGCKNGLIPLLLCA